MSSISQMTQMVKTSKVQLSSTLVEYILYIITSIIESYIPLSTKPQTKVVYTVLNMAIPKIIRRFGVQNRPWLHDAEEENDNVAFLGLIGNTWHFQQPLLFVQETSSKCSFCDKICVFIDGKMYVAYYWTQSPHIDIRIIYWYNWPTVLTLWKLNTLSTQSDPWFYVTNLWDLEWKDMPHSFLHYLLYYYLGWNRK